VDVLFDPAEELRRTPWFEFPGFGSHVCASLGPGQCCGPPQ
jgi:hypothetical protein